LRLDTGLQSPELFQRGGEIARSRPRAYRIGGACERGERRPRLRRMQMMLAVQMVIHQQDAQRARHAKIPCAARSVECNAVMRQVVGHR